MTFGTTVTIEDKNVDVTVQGDFIQGCAPTSDDPGEGDVFDIEKVVRDDTGEDIMHSLDKETLDSIARMGAEDHSDDGCEYDDERADYLDDVA